VSKAPSSEPLSVAAGAGEALEFELFFDDASQELTYRCAYCALVVGVLRYPLAPVLFRTEEVVDASATAVERVDGRWLRFG